MGPSFILGNLAMWWGYLRYDEAEYKAIKGKKGGEEEATKKK